MDMRSLTRSMCLAAGSAVVCAAVAIGPILAQGRGGPTKPTVNHKVRQERPIQLGTSGGNATDIANGFCCSGTLGALVHGKDQLQHCGLTDAAAAKNDFGASGQKLEAHAVQNDLLIKGQRHLVKDNDRLIGLSDGPRHQHRLFAFSQGHGVSTSTKSATWSPENP